MSQPTTTAEAQVYDLAGAEHKVLLDGSATGGVATVVEVTLLPGAGTPLHSDAREDLAWYVVEGSLAFNTPEGTRTLEPNTSMFVPRGTMHGIANPGSAPIKVLMTAVPAGIEAFFREAAEVLPSGVPAGPPPQEALEAFGQLAARHGITLHRD